MSKNYHTIWFITFGLSALMYLIYLYESKIGNNTDDIEEDDDDDVGEEYDEEDDDEEDVSTLGGMFVYMGAKKLEYGKQFNYLSFFFNKPSCRGSSPAFPGYLNSFVKGITP